ncbi:MAG: hypothetical protein V1769_05340 [Thermoplasmatota archaeon]
MQQPTMNQSAPTPVQPVVQPPPQQAPVVATTPKRAFDKRYLFLILIVIGIGGGFFAATRQPVAIPLPTPTDTPTPTPRAKPVVPFATQSAYLDLTVKLSSLSGSIQSLQVSDTTLSPPTVELPLGFPNE